MGKGKGKGKRKQVAIPADRDSKRPMVDGASSSTSAPLGNGGGFRGSPEDVTSDKNSVLKESPLPPPRPPPQASTQFIEAQGEPPTGGWKWNFNLEESPGGTPGGIELPAVPADWQIFEALPSEEESLLSLPLEAMIMTMLRCFNQHRMVG